MPAKRKKRKITPAQKSNFLKYSGLIVMIFAVLTLVSAVSYLFTWEVDQSLMSHPEMMGEDADVTNIGGKIGFRLSSFLIGRCFGLGSFALIFLLGAVAYRLFFWKRSIGLLRTAFVTLCGTFVVRSSLPMCLNLLRRRQLSVVDWEEMPELQLSSGWTIFSVRS